MSVEQLTLTGALTLLTYLQYSHFDDQGINADAVTATLCEMLTQLDTKHPGISSEYGWQKIA
jgi:hypothetical protein